MKHKTAKAGASNPPAKKPKMMYGGMAKKKKPAMGHGGMAHKKKK